MTKEDLKKILTDSTIETQICTNIILVRVDEIKKKEITSAREKPLETSNVPPQNREVKEKET